MQPRRVLLAVRRSQTRSEYALDLKRHGFEVAIADHGLECLDVLGRFAPDVVVIEPELLWGGGDGVLAVLSDMPELRSVPVLLLTTDCNRSAMYSIAQFPVRDFWVHPVSAERLTGRVARLALGDQWPLTAESPRRASACIPVRSTTSTSEPQRDLAHVGAS
jgi:CheY-like chemotaxis protein